MDDISRNTVVRCEIEAAAAWTATARQYHKDMETRVALATDTQTAYNITPTLLFAVVAHGVRSDATNSSVWQNS
eukprot:8387121-Alexandrium_andersonii.AAC.1